MPEQEPHGPEEQNIKDRVYDGLHEARQFAGKLDFEEVKSGEWFVELL